MPKKYTAYQNLRLDPESMNLLHIRKEITGIPMSVTVKNLVRKAVGLEPEEYGLNRPKKSK